MSHEALSKLNFCYKNFGYNWFVNFFKKNYNKIHLFVKRKHSKHSILKHSAIIIKILYICYLLLLHV